MTHSGPTRRSSDILSRIPEGATAVTDYNGVHRPPFAPDIVTMNNAHTTHFTDLIEPDVKHVLRGWAEAEGQPPGPAQHATADRDMRVWNIPTNVRHWAPTRRSESRRVGQATVGTVKYRWAAYT